MHKILKAEFRKFLNAEEHKVENANNLVILPPVIATSNRLAYMPLVFVLCIQNRFLK